MRLPVDVPYVSKIFDHEVLQALKIAIPLVVAELVSSLYALADTYFVKGLGESAISALGIASYIFWFAMAILALFNVPLSIAVAQYIGAKDFRGARTSLGLILALGTIIVLPISLILSYLTPWIVLVQSGSSGSTLKYATEYLYIRFYGFLIPFTALCLDTAIISSGRTLYSMISNSIGLILNIVLDPVLIYGLHGFPRLEVAGAAYATLISWLVTLVINLMFIVRMRLTPIFKIEYQKALVLLRLGLFAFLERLLFSLGNNIYAGIIARLGDVAMAAHNIGLRIESLIYMPGHAFTMAASVLVGQKVGAGDIEGAKRVGSKVIMLGTLGMGFIGIVIAFLAPLVATPFAPSEDVRKLASIYLLIAGLNEFGLGLTMITGGAIRGAGNVIVPFITNLTCLFAVRVALAVYLAPLINVIGPWIAMFIDIYLRGFVLYYVYSTRFHRLVKRVAERVELENKSS